MATLQVPLKWAQRSDKIFLTVELRDVQEKIEWVSPSELKIEAVSGDKSYSSVITFYKDLKIEESKWNKTGFALQFNLVKTEKGPYWPRLTKDEKKGPHSNILVDWNKYIDEDEEEEEGSKGLGDWDPDSMRNFDNDEDDSDDEDLPKPSEDEGEIKEEKIKEENLEIENQTTQENNTEPQKIIEETTPQPKEEKNVETEAVSSN